MSELLGLPLFNDNLLSYYRFEGNSNDSKGTQNGTDNGVTYSAANGRYTQGVGFVGAGTSYIDIAGISAAAPISATCWISPNSLPGVGTQANLVTGLTDSFQWVLNNSGQQIFSKNGSVAIGTSSTNVGTGSFAHIAATYNGTVVNFYLNGNQDGAGTNAQTLGNIIRFGGDTSLNNYNGAMDDLGIFNKVLSQTDINILYQSGQTYLGKTW